MFILFISVPPLVIVFAVLAIGWIVARIRKARSGPFRKFVRWTALSGVILYAAWFFVIAPVLLGYLVSQFSGTRHFEQGYPGPTLDPVGRWILDETERRGDTPADLRWRALQSGERKAEEVRFTAEDGVELRAFWLQPPNGVEPGPCTWVLAHGLFRSSLELEPVGRMLRDDFGCPVLMLDLRNHGGSGEAPMTVGRGESLDVLASVQWLRGQGVENIGLFGVSLGSAAVAYAVPRAGALSGLVLDAPITDQREIIERSMSRLGVPVVQQSVIFWSLSHNSEVAFDAIQPMDALTHLTGDVPVLLIGGGDDFRCPPESVHGLAARLPTQRDRLEVWIREGAAHGKVWMVDPAGYRERLGRLIARIR